MKAKLLRLLHFLKLDVLLVRALERLSAGLLKKLESLKKHLDGFFDPTSDE